MKKYRLVKGVANNHNAISIEHCQTHESISFCGRVKKKAEEIFGKGMSLDSISTTFGVSFRFENLLKNRTMAKKLIKIVELEDELLQLKTNNYDTKRNR